MLQATEQGQFAGSLLRPDDGRFVRELVLGVLRRQLTLDTIHDAYGGRPATELDPPVRLAVRIGLYQALFMDGIPPHAAVSESVDTLRLRSQKAYVNGVLRAVQRDSHRVPIQGDRGGASPRKRLERPGRTVTFFSREVFPDPHRDRIGHLAAVYSHPAFLVERWLAREDEDVVIARMAANNEPASLVLRPRLGRVDAEGLAERFARDGVGCEIVAGPLPGLRAVELRRGQEDVFGSPTFRAGLATVQEPSQMAAGAILAPREGEVVWDACAAPGGKATQLGELAEGLAHVVATDANEQRLERLVENVARLGLEATITIGAYELGSTDPPPGRPERGFDAILLDAPCSNSAVLGRRPEARWRLRPESFANFAGRQAAMLEHARRHLAPGGRLIYSVCALEPEEGAGHGLAPTGSPLVFVEGGDEAWRRSVVTRTD